MRLQLDRFKESRARREAAIAELERALLQELWDAPDRQSHIHPPAVACKPPAVACKPPVVTASEPPESQARGLSTQAKQVITIVATAVALAIAGTLKGTGATTPHEIPKSTQPGP